MPIDARRHGVAVDYPLLGEPPVVELANTLYTGPDGELDFLGDLDLARGWITALGGVDRPDPAELDARRHRLLVQLRVAIRSAFTARSTDTMPPDGTAQTITTAANLAAPVLRLDWVEGGAPRLSHDHDTTDVDGFIASLAYAAMHIVTDPVGPQVLVCDRPACHMRFLQHHRRRRYCNPACANADRQARFHRNHQNRNPR